MIFCCRVVFHAQIEEEAGSFDLEDVAREISEKLIRRHPHVFGDPEDKEEDADAVIDRWEKIKAEEKKAREKNRIKVCLRNFLPRSPSTLWPSRSISRGLAKLGLENSGKWG